MRIIKDADIRKNEILDAAQQLFFTNGYDNTSTNAILEKCGIARGTLYYHFRSKEEILDGIIGRITQKMLSDAEKAASDTSLSAYKRLLEALIALDFGGRYAPLIEHIHKPQNALMHRKIQAVLLRGIPSVLTSVIKDGIAEGVFATEYPYESLEMIVSYISTVMHGDIIELSNEERIQKMKSLAFNCARLFGMKQSGSKLVAAVFGIEDTYA
ncbi:TetR/AcrR family transcriptional regulator [Treponema sp. OMZ 840]|uniref:TetR/AcrR family transcriptional regulator n=1 Tax=Treponema sp. OMZ 840 TaxID=244313 RepID=UPI003D91FA1A